MVLLIYFTEPVLVRNKDNCAFLFRVWPAGHNVRRHHGWVRIELSTMKFLKSIAKS